MQANLGKERARLQPASRAGAWLAIALLLALPGSIRAESVYKCIGAAGEVAYQGQPCAPAQQARLIELDPAPAWQPSPEYALETRDAASRHALHGAAPRRRAGDEPVSYECRAADGQVFYRHSGCPHSVAADGSTTGTSRRGSRASAGGTVSVTARRVSRDEACREIGRAGAIGRSGRRYDESISTYERNLGNDPCR